MIKLSEKTKILEMFKLGISIKQIAQDLSLSHVTVRKYLKESGLSQSESRMEREREIVEKYLNGADVKEIMAELNKTHQYIYSVLKRSKVELRDDRGRRTYISSERRKEIAKKISGKSHWNWKGGKSQTHEGYVYIKNPKYGEIGEPKIVKEHRYVMEQHLGRRLSINEHVHHINGIKDDNRLENLVIKKSIEHYGEVTCPCCQHQFRVR